MKTGKQDHDQYGLRAHWKGIVVVVCLALFYCSHFVRNYLFSEWWFSERPALGEVIAFQQRDGDIPALLLLDTGSRSGVLHIVDTSRRHTISTPVSIVQGPSGAASLRITGNDLRFTLIADNAGPRYYTCRECTAHFSHSRLPVLWEAIPAAKH
ncbi:hypothetical protein [Silvimonas amylolytica]|uniref:Uncharacterized protein n=1 Tax=Silvimonas amylolytica TaxID=449663 RepID=A0ABQ2PFW4_9NEIS|nr:hypothetical protein [Silvimonas amylolytica]GGP24410.1 hypothetical protein GCM10010971_02290 [Silvimonas amylolytica]